MKQATIYIQGMKHKVRCVICDTPLTQDQVKKGEINQMTYACSEEHYEECL